MEAFVCLEPTDDDEEEARGEEKESGGQKEKTGWGRWLGKVGRKVETVRKIRDQIKLIIFLTIILFI